MRSPRSAPGGRPLVALILVQILVLFVEHAGAVPGNRDLQLEVFVNDSPAHLIAAFTMLEDRRIVVRRAELEEIGLKPRRRGAPDELIVLEDLAGLSYRYDEPQQRIFFTVGDELRVTKNYDASGRPAAPASVRGDYGGVLNYTLFASSAPHVLPNIFTFNGTSATLEARAFSPYGTLSQSAILHSSPGDQSNALRLDTTYSYSDPQSMVRYRAGDLITGGLTWTRPIRLGGLQMQRNFGLRPDLVTLPLPSITGTAAVPSSVDVYVNNLKTFSQEVGSGPFQVANIPVVSGSGMASVVIRDASGRATEMSLPFYTSPALLAKDLMDFSLEAGLPRLSYGTPDDTYVDRSVASASLRRGIFDWLTVEGHAETGAGLMNGGAGIVLRTGAVGVASAAVAASRADGNTGFQSYASYDTKILGINVQASSQYTFGSYDDLASVTARRSAPLTALQQNIAASLDPYAPLNLPPSPLWASARPPKALNRLTLGVPLPFDSSSLSASFIQLYDAVGNRSNILTTTWSRGLPGNGSFFTTVFADLGNRANSGIFVGVSRPLGGGATASVSASGGRDANGVTVDAVKPLDQAPGSVGWRIRDNEGGIPDRSTAVSYRSSYGRIETGVSQSLNGVGAAAVVEGAVVTIGGGVYLANRVDDAFAVVETGVPGVEVLYENRPAGVTGSDGRLLIPNLRAYQGNKIAIDPRNLPVDAEIATTQDVVAPADRAGVRVNFAVRTDTRAALLVLTGPEGTPLPVGSRGQVEGGETFVVGYDGQAYVKGLGAANKVAVTLADRDCRASFAYAPRPNEQVVISPLVCQ